MLRGLLHTAHPFIKLVFSLIVFLMFGITLTLIGMYLAGFIYDLDINRIQQILEGDQAYNHVSVLRIVQAAQTTGLFLLPPVILSFFFSYKGLKYIGVNSSVSMCTLFLSAFLIISAIPLVNFLSEINQSMIFPDFLSEFENTLKEKNTQYEVLLENFLRFNSLSDLIVNLIIVGVLPAIAEEFAFRGLIQNILIEWTKRKHLSVFITAIFFSLIHLHVYGILPRILLGLLLGYLFLWSGNIWIPVFAHFINNSFIVLYFFFMNKKNTPRIDLESIGTTSDIVYSALVSATVVSLLMYAVYYYEKRKERLR